MTGCACAPNIPDSLNIPSPSIERGTKKEGKTVEGDAQLNGCRKGPEPSEMENQCCVVYINKRPNPILIKLAVVKRKPDFSARP